MKRILVVDDDPDICFLLSKFLTKYEYNVDDTPSAHKALEMIEKNVYDLAICDYRMEEMDGKTLMLRIKEKQQIPVIIITAHNDLKTAVLTIKSGAFDYILKPLFPEEILNTVQNALKSGTRSAEVSESGKAPAPVAKTPVAEFSENDSYIFGNSYVFRQIMHQISLVAPTDYSVILYGESGSGKEAIAQEIHKKSHRKQYPFVAIDCGALSRDIAGSELFGHEKGSFTGAIQQKQGSFEVANKGTIFLDEVANLSYDTQVSLLRVIQERKMRRVGGTRDIDLDIRIIIASNENLQEAARKGAFREDLYHRFNEFTIEVPPLRDRKDDIMLFANHFLKLANQNLGKNIKGFAGEIESIFREYHWPGNLRELKNVVKRAALLSDGDYIEARSLPFEINNFQRLLKNDSDIAFPEIPQHIESKIPAIPSQPERATEIHSLKMASIDHEYELIVKTLRENNFNKSRAARVLNIDRKTLYNKIALYQEIILGKKTNNEI
ncbi:sigma-54-dependent transcriptional regulator [Flavihumibacter solisilvae]|uniref:Chemotaxis protein CheY n=1 Tax=Flavihumibacter solisilvae TaxID=1349421 RepID=A0A0C1ITL4_9BACT|nr:sigma-54 dependent transcriptional regulator [Flavihumibacter solisilvae]KIC93794.1 chemotaxis protein CheY [Flavihumibacter solisilvae]